MPDLSPAASTLYLGLISGTSADGIDAALVRFSEGASPLRCELVMGRTPAIGPRITERIGAPGR